VKKFSVSIHVPFPPELLFSDFLPNGLIFVSFSQQIDFLNRIYEEKLEGYGKKRSSSFPNSESGTI